MGNNQHPTYVDLVQFYQLIMKQVPIMTVICMYNSVLPRKAFYNCIVFMYFHVYLSFFMGQPSHIYLFFNISSYMDANVDETVPAEFVATPGNR